MTKKDTLASIRKRFLKEKVLKLDDILSTIGATSRRTALRYLKDLDYISSFTHSGKYYTLKEVASFDENGLWHVGEIGFSTHGTLLKTLVYLVEKSNAGMSHDELQQEVGLVVKASLLNLLDKRQMRREKLQRRYVYLSSDSVRAGDQTRAREKLHAAPTFSDAVALRVLVKAYQLLAGSVSADSVAEAIKKEGSSISKEQVQLVFRHYGLEKKRTSGFYFPRL